ncbi:MAG: ErfK/YbiS/YcfS/YnhG family protein [Frankiales bacterium]|nr:ErfK/YbiS/YcfS/YnhG family protein [Frankiales bacterium]
MSRTPRRLAAPLAVALLLAGCSGSAQPTVEPTPVLVPSVSPAGEQAGRVPWDKPLAITVTNGTLRAINVRDPDGLPVEGSFSNTGWRSAASQVLPDSTYQGNAVVVDAAGRAKTIALALRTALPAHTLHAVLSPGDGKVVGVGMPVIATLDQRITSPADRALIESRLTVTSDPPVVGAWRWMSPSELHYRGPDYWAAGSTISARANLERLQLSEGTWGSGDATTSYTIGRRLIATVDVATKLMDVVQDGKLLRTVKVSTGRDKYPTKGGVHLVLEKTKLKIMDSATVGIPRKSPDGYYEKVPNSVRISYGGAFVHSADWSVRDQGVRNVSHGCVNISPADAAWFFDLVKRGDVVDIIHANAPPKLSDPGMSDWNIPFSSWHQ